MTFRSSVSSAWLVTRGTIGLHMMLAYRRLGFLTCGKYLPTKDWGFLKPGTNISHPAIYTSVNTYRGACMQPFQPKYWGLGFRALVQKIRSHLEDLLREFSGVGPGQALANHKYITQRIMYIYMYIHIQIHVCMYVCIRTLE